MYGHLWGGMGWMMLLWILFWIVIIVGAVLLVLWLVRQNGPRPPGGEDPLAILKRRYARGEITREEYERMRQELS